MGGVKGVVFGVVPRLLRSVIPLPLRALPLLRGSLPPKFYARAHSLDAPPYGLASAPACAGGGVFGASAVRWVDGGGAAKYRIARKAHTGKKPVKGGCAQAVSTGV